MDCDKHTFDAELIQRGEALWLLLSVSVQVTSV